MDDVGELLNEAYLKAASMENAVSGFGLRPFNPDIFTDEHFSASTVTEEPQPQSDEVAQVAVDQISQPWAKHMITQLSLIPRANKARTRKRRVESAADVTGSPYKKMLTKKIAVLKSRSRPRG